MFSIKRYMASNHFVTEIYREGRLLLTSIAITREQADVDALETLIKRLNE